jgi:galacturan 1,4-alpha-galacturonidase
MYSATLLTFCALITTFVSADPNSYGSNPRAPYQNGQTCTVTALGDGQDDSANILKAFEKCNNGGTVVFPKGENYFVATVMNPVLYDVTIDWEGLWTVSFFFSFSVAFCFSFCFLKDFCATL